MANHWGAGWKKRAVSSNGKWVGLTMTVVKAQVSVTSINIVLDSKGVGDKAKTERDRQWAQSEKVN